MAKRTRTKQAQRPAKKQVAAKHARSKRTASKRAASGARGQGLSALVEEILMPRTVH
jgi:hypothetical protein